MKNIEFPVVEDENTAFPNTEEGPRCPVCSNNDVSDGNEHVLIHGGAMLLKDLDNGVEAAQLVGNLQAFLFMDWEAGFNAHQS